MADYDEVYETEETTRAVYDGSISDTYLRSLSAYYNMHAPIGASYTITRPSQYRYQLVYGRSSNGSFYEDATVVRIDVGTYNTFTTLSVSDGQTLTVDVSGSTGYVYSSYSAFQPSYYIADSNRVTSIALFALLGVVLLSTLVRFISSLLKR